jgi:hypothetical protein
MTVYISADAKNLREELASLRNQGGYQEQQFYFDGLVTNGTFDADTDWTKGTGWTISAGVASYTSGTSSNLTQTVDVIKGRSYYFSFNLSNTQAGTYLGLRLGSGTNQFAYSGISDGLKTGVLVAGQDNYSIQFSAATGGDFAIDNISIFEVDANDDVVHRLPKGWKPKDVFEDGLLQREGAAYDYEVVYDGFDYYVKPAVAPSATTQTCVIGVKA